MRKEVWKDIAGYEGSYRISNYGRIKSLKRYVQPKNRKKYFIKEKLLKKIVNNIGYCNISLSKNGILTQYQIHVLVGRSFVPGYIKGLEINHKKGNKKDNRAWMLEWVTHSANIQHSFDILKRKNKKEIPIIAIKFNKKVYFKSITYAAKKLKLHKSAICRVLKQKQLYSGGFKFQYQ